jgi:alkyl hydroperoxide reductase subunit AhpC
MLIVGDKFPKFDVPACVSLEKNGFKRIQNDTFKGKWVVYFFYPKDFSFICPTELVGLARKNKEFAERNAVLVAGSTDNEYSHQAWRRTHPDLKDLPFPMMAAGKLASDLGILDARDHVCLRCTFVVDPEGVIQFATVYPLDVARCIPETLRVLDAIQSGEECPCDWDKDKHPPLSPAAGEKGREHTPLSPAAGERGRG